MFRGLYAAASGMHVLETKTNVIANNLANVNTTGFKRDEVLQKEFKEVMLHAIEKSQTKPVGRLGLGTLVDGSFTHFTQGALRPTNRSLDVAILGDGFFAVQTERGVRYTRNGSFHVQNGMLTNMEGYPVLDVAGNPIPLEFENVVITQDGFVQVGGEVVTELQVVRFATPELLMKEGSSLYNSNGMEPMAVESKTVRSGYLESSNVESIREMVGLIEAQRLYEANQKVIQTFDETSEQGIRLLSK